VADSGETVTLELVGARLLALNTEVRDLQQRFAGLEVRLGALETRFSAMEARIGALEGRFAVQEERMTRLISLVVRIAERIGAPAE
jgi:uncharacterized coiled-coil protein SlyX